MVIGRICNEWRVLLPVVLLVLSNLYDEDLFFFFTPSFFDFSGERE